MNLEITSYQLEEYLKSTDQRGLGRGFSRRYPNLYTYLTNNFTGKNVFELCYKYLYGEKFCLNCKKLLGGRGFIGFKSGYRIFCSDRCAANHPYRLNKIKSTNMKKYGTECLFTTSYVKNKIKVTNLKRWGVAHISQNVDIHKKQRLTSFGRKYYKFPSGKERSYQGYENFAFDYLLKIYKEEDIITDKSLIPKFLYVTLPDNKYHRYYPDIYIKSKNLIIEVKSTWTNKLNVEVNILKKQSVINKNYKFKTLVYNQKGELINE